MVHYLFADLISIKVWDEIPVEEHAKGLRVLIMSEKGREGRPFSLTLLRELTTLHILFRFI